MSMPTNPLKLPASPEAAEDFFRRRAGDAKPSDLRAFLARAPDRPPDPGDELPDGWS